MAYLHFITMLHSYNVTNMEGNNILDIMYCAWQNVISESDDN